MEEALETRRLSLARRSASVASAPAPTWSGTSRPPRRRRTPLRVVGTGTAESAARRAPETPRPRVVVVDDERSIRLLCRVNLQLAGFDVVEAADGREALALIERDPPDLVLLDVMMPDLDGWEVAERLAAGEATRSVPVVFLSARASADDRRRGYESGAVDYVVKPFDPLALAPRLERTLERIGRGERDELRRELLDSDPRP